VPLEITERIDKAKQCLQSADAVLITAGAGMGVDSGLPDFRGNEGFWNAYPPIAQRGISFVEMANPYWFEREPRLAWAFYGHRLALYKKTQPHRGFKELLEYAQSRTAGFFVFTSNVDGQFQKTGFPEEKICECHGTIHHLQCTIPCSRNIWEDTNLNIELNDDTFTAIGDLPLCRDCHALARPNILMFGDWNWISARTANQEQNLEKWISTLQQHKLQLAIIEIGAGTAVATVRLTSEDIARKTNATLIRINPRDFWTPHGHISIPLGAREGIMRVLT